MKLQSSLVGSCLVAATLGFLPSHAPLRGQSPSPHVNLKNPPQTVTLKVGEPGLGSTDDYITVFNSNGELVSGNLSASTTGNSTELSVPFQSSMSGWYLVRWNVVSEDGHEMGGEDGTWWTFGVRAPSRLVKLATSLSLSEPGGGRSTLRPKINGFVVGKRRLEMVGSDTVTSVRWRVLSQVPSSLKGASFSWPVSQIKNSQASTKAYRSEGVLPIPGQYQLAIGVTSKTSSGSATKNLVATVTVSK